MTQIRNQILHLQFELVLFVFMQKVRTFGTPYLKYHSSEYHKIWTTARENVWIILYLLVILSYVNV